MWRPGAGRRPLLSLTAISANVYYRTASIARRIPFLTENWIEIFLRTMAEQILQRLKSPRRMGLDFYAQPLISGNTVSPFRGFTAS